METLDASSFNAWYQNPRSLYRRAWGVKMLPCVAGGELDFWFPG